jgi:hypothetical protein
MNVNAHGNHRVRQRRTGPRRAAAGLLTALLAGTALLAAACGGGSAGSAGSTGSSPYAKALAYTRCMRSNGVANYPDPNAQGQILMQPNNGIDYGSPQLAHAAKTCAKLAPKLTITAQQRQQILSQGLKWAACMRAHGITNIPDPSTAGGGIAAEQIPKADANLPQLPAAEQACRSLLPGAPSGGGS